MKLLEKLTENIWLSVTSVGLGLVFATHYDTVRAMLAKAAADPIGSVGIILFLLGLAGLANHFLEKNQRDIRKDEGKLIVNAMFDGLIKITLLLVASPEIQETELKHKLIAATEELHKTREAVLRLAEKK